MFKLKLLFLLPIAIQLYYCKAYCAQVEIVFQGTINIVEAGSYSVGQTISGSVTYNSKTPLTHSPTGSPPWTTNFNGAIDHFILDVQKVDNVTFNILSQTVYANGIDYIMNFSIAGFDKNSGLSESIDLTLHGPNLIDSIYFISENPNTSNSSSMIFEYTLQKIGLDDGYLQERFYGIINSIEFKIISAPVFQPSLFLLLR
jgi:hypothetical protein